jgi:TolA-binding protein
MKNSLLKFNLILIVASIFLLCLIGCSGSEEAKREIPGTTELMQNEMNDLKSQNESLKKQIAKLEQDNRTAVARAAELETQLVELKDKAAAPPPVVQKPILANARESYQEALNLFRSRSYIEAASLFQSALDAGIQEKMQDNCYYWLGECAYGEKKYNEAIEHFKKVFTFKISEKKDDSQLMIGNSYLAMGNKEKAKEAFERFTKKFPASPFIKRVKEKLGKL